MNNTTLQTFDEWHTAKYGHNFASGPWMRDKQFGFAIRILLEEMHNYVTDLLAAALQPKDDRETPAEEAAKRLGYESFNYTERN